MAIKKYIYPEPTPESHKASEHATRILNLSNMMFHDLDFAEYRVLDKKNSVELIESKTLLEIIKQDTEKIIEQIDICLSSYN